MDKPYNNTTMKILCFTTSYNRPYYIYNTINNILNQSYDSIDYGINLNIDNDNDKTDFLNILSDFISDSRLKIVFNKNQHQHINYLNAIKSFGSTDYDLFFKIDDDDIYNKHYIKKSIKYFIESNCDILSYVPQTHINNCKLKGAIESIGVWGPDSKSNIKFGMPPTYIFNKQACDIIISLTVQQCKKIHSFEDCAWREFWRKHNLKSHVITDEKLFVYNIHQNNISSKYLLNKEEHKAQTENEHFCLVFIISPKWQSYVYLNKRNNRLYNIKNNDHGSYTITDNILTIKWANWGTEKFIKQSVTDTIYNYKLINT